MPEAFASIGSMLGTAAPALTGINAGLGMVGNIMNAITRGKAVGNLTSAENKYANMSPEKLAGLVTRAEQPLGADLTQNVGNLVQADLGTRGLSQAPGVFAAEEAQYLAPYKLQQQNTALQLVMKQLGLPIEYAQAILGATQGGSDPTLALMMLALRNAQAPGATPGVTPTSAGGAGGGIYGPLAGSTEVPPNLGDTTIPDPNAGVNA